MLSPVFDPPLERLVELTQALLALAKRLLGHLPGRDVLHQGIKALDAPVWSLSGDVFHLDMSPGCVGVRHELTEGDPLASERRVHVVGHLGVGRLAHDFAHLLAYDALAPAGKPGLVDLVVEPVAPLGVDVRHQHRQGVGQGAELLLVLGQRDLGQDPVGDVGPFREDAGDRAGRIDCGLIDEVDEASLDRPPRRPLKLDRQGAADERLPRRVGLVHEFEVALPLDLRQCLAHGLAQHVAVADELHV
jgi:hypothetical protein